MVDQKIISIQLGAESTKYLWRSSSEAPKPSSVQVIDDTWRADHAYRKALAGSALVWSGDFQNARNLLQAMTRRFDKQIKHSANLKSTHDSNELSVRERFEQFRAHQKKRSQVLDRLLVTNQWDEHHP